jgi:PTH1 family peptidyl-tRNA hydrolase
MDELGFPDFIRVRVGVGRPPAYMDPADYVLQAFAKEEREAADATVARAADVIEDLLELSFLEVQQKHH